MCIIFCNKIEITLDSLRWALIRCMLVLNRHSTMNRNAKKFSHFKSIIVCCSVLWIPIFFNFRNFRAWYACLQTFKFILSNINATKLISHSAVCLLKTVLFFFLVFMMQFLVQMNCSCCYSNQNIRSINRMLFTM